MLPVHAGTPFAKQASLRRYLPWHDPREATRLLRYALHRQGFTHTYQSNGNGMAVLSVLAELTVWCKDGFFVWHEEGIAVEHPIDDPVGAAQRIADRRRRPQPTPWESSYEEHSPTDSVRGHSA